jgi:single-stranded-DNA-specific exonuclease
VTRAATSPDPRFHWRSPRTVVRRDVQVGPPRRGEVHPVLQRVYRARGLTGSAELRFDLGSLPPPSALGGIDKAVDLLAAALDAGSRILVVADFDADGATSCALAVRALRALGAAHVDYVVPDRFRFGYGLTPEIVEVARERRPDLLITVDNGISSIEGVDAARRAGIAVLVTDHHLPGERLPDADAIVNPNVPGDPFPSRHLAGVGVIFYVVTALRARLREDGWFGPGRPEPNLAELLDLVALGTVADVVPLDRLNRTLVSQGLGRINAGRAHPGVAALLEAGGRSPGRVVASDLGFAAGPRLNAAGRLEHMSLGIECLLTDDPGEARRMASRLDALNRERREIEEQMRSQAFDALEHLVLPGGDRLPAALCLYDESWHQGVIGILAGRVREAVHRPVIAFAPGGARTVKGSARSIPGLHVRDALDAVATRHPELLERFGGHAMAAGLTIPLDALDRFRAAFTEEVAARLDAHALENVILSDGELAPEDICLELAEAIRQGGPWGQSFPEPVFDGEFEVVQQRVVGERHLKLVLAADAARHAIDAIAFTMADALPDGTARVRAAYRLDVNDYMGKRSAQLIIEHIEAC